MIQRIIVALGLVAATGTVAAADAPWQEGEHYFLIESAQADASPDTVEVIEVFSYGCPHCHDFEPFAEKIRQGLPEGAEFVRTPAALGHASWRTFAHGYFAAQALGIADKAHAAVFDAVYKDHSVSAVNPTLDELAAVYASYGVDAETLLDTADSFGVNAMVKRADDHIRSWGVTGTPTIIVDGKYRFNVASAGGFAQSVELAHWLVDKELASSAKIATSSTATNR